MFSLDISNKKGKENMFIIIVGFAFLAIAWLIAFTKEEN
jgi:hypothetical protein